MNDASKEVQHIKDGLDFTDKKIEVLQDILTKITIDITGLKLQTTKQKTKFNERIDTINKHGCLPGENWRNELREVNLKEIYRMLDKKVAKEDYNREQEILRTTINKLENKIVVKVVLAVGAIATMMTGFISYLK